MSCTESNLMTPKEFQYIGELFWGKRWKNKMASFLKKHRSSIYRYCNGTSNVADFIADSLRNLEKNFKETGNRPTFS